MDDWFSKLMVCLVWGFMLAVSAWFIVWAWGGWTWLPHPETWSLWPWPL